MEDAFLTAPPEEKPDRDDATKTEAPSSSDPNGSAPLPPSVVEAWATFDLTARRATLDQQGLDIADRQENSSVARKRLAGLTRVFKKDLNDGTATNKSTMGLLKEYQGEIDKLTSRSKAAEIAFLALYKALYEAPDPVQELRAAAAERATAAELRDERAINAERSVTSKKYEARIAELEKKLQRETKLAKDEAREEMEMKQAQWMSAQHQAVEAYELREQELLHQISLGNENARRLKTGADALQQQLNESRSQLEEVKETRTGDYEMVLEDLEKAKAETKTLRRRCIELEANLSGEGVEGTEGIVQGEGSTIGRSALSAELAARDVEVSQLKDHISALEGVLGGKDKEKSNEFAKLTSSIAEKNGEITRLNDTLGQLPTVEEYETMKRQFETLREFQLNETADDLAGADSATSAGDGSEAESLEKRLLGKVKLLEGKLLRLRIELTERDGRISTLVASVSSYEEQVSDQKSLIARLEDGINAMTGDPGSARNLPTPDPDTPRTQGDAPADSANWDWGEQREAAVLQHMIKEEPSMLDIVAGQRDRFRARTMELETENRKLVESMERLGADLDALKNDNVRLYGKIRFVQSYQKGGATGSALAAAEAGLAGGAGAAGSATDEEGGSSAFLGKYRTMYEDMANPYTLFNRRERHKRMSEMSAPERLTLRAGQRAMSTKTSRLIAFFYVLALHFLVILVLSTASASCGDSVTTKAEHLSKTI